MISEIVAAVEGTRGDDPGDCDGVKENQERRFPELWRPWRVAGPGMELTREKSGVWGRK